MGSGVFCISAAPPSAYARHARSISCSKSAPLALAIAPPRLALMFAMPSPHYAEKVQNYRCKHKHKRHQYYDYCSLFVHAFASYSPPLSSSAAITSRGNSLPLRRHLTSCRPVVKMYRRTIVSTKRDSSSIRYAVWPCFSAAISVVPLPPNGSYTPHAQLVLSSIISSSY